MRKQGVDFSRLRRNFQGKPVNFVAYGVVGHIDQNPAFTRVENGKILVEVTLHPGGEEIVAELGMEGQGAGYAFYIPLCIGCRVLIEYPQGEEDPVVTKRLTDREFPFPATVAGISTVGNDVDAALGSTTAPQFAFLQVPDGTILAIETGPEGDIAIASGSNIQMSVSGGQAIHLAGRTHIGNGWQTPPTGATTGAGGEIEDGDASVAHSPTPRVPAPYGATPIPVPPGLPADGIVRAKDRIQTTFAVDPTFWTWLRGVDTAIRGLVPGIPPLPTAMGSEIRTASRNTCGD